MNPVPDEHRLAAAVARVRGMAAELRLGVEDTDDPVDTDAWRDAEALDMLITAASGQHATTRDSLGRVIFTHRYGAITDEDWAHRVTNHSERSTIALAEADALLAADGPLQTTHDIAQLLRRRAAREAPNAAGALLFMADTIETGRELPPHMLGVIPPDRDPGRVDSERHGDPSAWGHCTTCGHQARLTSAGTMAQHSPSGRGDDFGNDCPGIGTPPRKAMLR